MKKRPTLPPPVGYKSWLAYAVATMETCSLYNELSWGNEPQWPESTTRTQMQEAAEAELRCTMNELREIPPVRYRLLNRSTEGFSVLMYANIIERGSVDEWVLLWRACNSDPETRQAVVDLLPTGDPLQADAICMWADLLAVPRPTLGHPIP